MAVSLYFGLPGCGKTTLLTSLALKAVKSKRYRNVYSNVPLKIFGVTYIKNECIGKYILEDGLILIDEASLYADSRDHKNFSIGQITYFLEHRHFNVDIALFTQQWDGVDRKIRVITDRVYYVYKGMFLGHWFTRYYRIPYGIIIPDPHKSDGQKLGEIIQGYCKPNLIVRLISPWLYRPKYYGYFDSWERPTIFDPLPSKYRPYYEIIGNEVITSKKQAKKLTTKQKGNLPCILLRCILLWYNRMVKDNPPTRSMPKSKNIVLQVYSRDDTAILINKHWKHRQKHTAPLFTAVDLFAFQIAIEMN